MCIFHSHPSQMRSNVRKLRQLSQNNFWPACVIPNSNWHTRKTLTITLGQGGFSPFYPKIKRPQQTDTYTLQPFWTLKQRNTRKTLTLTLCSTLFEHHLFHSTPTGHPTTHPPTPTDLTTKCRTNIPPNENEMDDCGAGFLILTCFLQIHFKWIVWMMFALETTLNNTHPNIHCDEAVKDGLHHPEMFKLAGLGSHGSQPSHCSRDLVRSLSPAFQDLPQISFLKVPVRGHRVAEPLEIELEVQYPHDVFAHYSKHPQHFQQIFGSDEELQAYWGQKDCQDPAYKYHPALAKEDFSTKCIPIRLHSDGVVMSKHESLHVISWSSLFGTGQILEVQMMFTSIVKSACLKDEHGMDTLKDIYRCLRWSLAACLAGLHPVLNWDDEPWPENSERARLANTPLNPQGKFLGCFQLLGDLDELCNVYGLRHFNSRTPCFWCNCNTQDIPWTDFSPAAGWRQTLEEPGRVMVAPSDHELWWLPGMSIFSVAWDILHGLDLGPCLHVLGNCLEDLMALKPPRQTSEARVAVIWEAAQEFYRTMGIENRMVHLDVKSFRHGPEEYPRLRAKGNEARHFLPVMERLLQRFDPADSPYRRVRNRMVASLLSFYQVVATPNPLALRGRGQCWPFPHASVLEGLLLVVCPSHAPRATQVANHSQISLPGARCRAPQILQSQTFFYLCWGILCWEDCEDSPEL